MGKTHSSIDTYSYKCAAGLKRLLVDRDIEVKSVMIVMTPPSKGMKSRKRKRETEELSSPSVDAVSEKNLRETAPMILARWKTAAYKSSSEPRRLAEVLEEIEVSKSMVTEEDFNLRRQARKRIRRMDKHGKGMLAKNGSRANIRLLANK